MVFESDNTRHVAAAATGQPLDPLTRFWKLLRPEWPDVWLVLVFAFVVGLLTLATPIAVEALVNTVAFGRLMQPVVVLALILLTFLGFSAAMRTLKTYVVEIIQRRLFARVAADVAYRLPRAEMEAAEGQYPPELVNRFFDIVTTQKVTASLLLDGTGLVLNTIVGMTVLAFYHPWLLGFDVVLLASMVFIIFILGRGAIGTAVKESKYKYAMASWLEDIARCPTTFRCDGGGELALERADRMIDAYLKARRSHFRILIRQIIFALGLQAVAATALLGLGGWLVITSELTLGQLVAAELIVAVIVGAFAKLGKHIEGFYDLMASVDKLGNLFDIPIERQDGMMYDVSSRPAEVEFKGVAFPLSNPRQAIQNLSFRVERRQSLAVFGPSGSGKSGLLDLLFGVRRPVDGCVLIDGFVPCDLRPDVLRKRVTLVRGTEVFHGTIEENIHLHRPDVTSSQVRDALAAVGLLDEVEYLEGGIDCLLTGGGRPLTENQLRLLAIARAIVGKPSLLLIDGLLDCLPDRDFEKVVGFLTSGNRPWTVVVATGRRSIAERFDDCIELHKKDLI